MTNVIAPQTPPSSRSPASSAKDVVVAQASTLAAVRTMPMRNSRRSRTRLTIQADPIAPAR